MHKVLPGAVDKSYGVNVARLANLPLEVTIRADDILKKLEASHNPNKALLSKSEKEVYVLDKVKDIDINQLSPLDALNILAELQKHLKK